MMAAGDSIVTGQQLTRSAGVQERGELRERREALLPCNKRRERKGANV